jgi:peptidoglycan/LPS O-acetylase OafA/YrhL
MSKQVINPINNISYQHKLHGLDHLRALAIISVLCFHYQFFGHPEWERGAISGFGWTGVDLFFVLSGFLIAGQLFNTVTKGKIISLPEFFIKRFFRIIPPYLLVLVIYLAVPAAREWGHLSPIWKYFTFTVNFGQDLSKYGTFSHSWSLCVEEQFYLVLPLIFWLFIHFKGGKKAGYFIAALFIFGFIIRLLSWKYLVGPYLSTDQFGARWNEFMYYPTYNHLDGLLVGVSIAGLFTFYPKAKEWVNTRSYLILCCGIALLIGGFFLCKVYASYNTAIFGFPVISLGYGLVLAAFVSPSNVFFKLKSKVTALIATLSYSIYLSHKIIIHLLQNLLEKLGIDKNSVLTMVICAICVFTGALVMRYLIEKPALRMRDRILNKVNNKASLRGTKQSLHSTVN